MSAFEHEVLRACVEEWRRQARGARPWRTTCSGRWRVWRAWWRTSIRGRAPGGPHRPGRGYQPLCEASRRQARTATSAAAAPRRRGSDSVTRPTAEANCGVAASSAVVASSPLRPDAGDARRAPPVRPGHLATRTRARQPRADPRRRTAPRCRAPDRPPTRRTGRHRPAARARRAAPSPEHHSQDQDAHRHEAGCRHPLAILQRSRRRSPASPRSEKATSPARRHRRSPATTVASSTTPSNVPAPGSSTQPPGPAAEMAVNRRGSTGPARGRCCGRCCAGAILRRPALLVPERVW